MAFSSIRTDRTSAVHQSVPPASLFVLLLLTMLLWAAPVFANNHWDQHWSPLDNESMSARSLGMGRAYTAIAEGPDAIYYNAAGIAQKPWYLIELGGGLAPTAYDVNAWNVHFGVVDSVTAAPVAVGVSYNYTANDSQQLWKEGDLAWMRLIPPFSTQNATPETYYDEDENEIAPYRKTFGRWKNGSGSRHTLRLSLAGAVSEHFQLGFTGYYIHSDRSQRRSFDRANLDFGLMISGAGFKFGASVENMINIAYDLMPLRSRFGFAYNIPEVLNVGIDWVMAWDVYGEKPGTSSVDVSSTATRPVTYRTYKEGHLPGFALGAEYLIDGFLPIRVGNNWDMAVDKAYLSFGTGYVEPQFMWSISYIFSFLDLENGTQAKVKDHLVSTTIRFSM